jgi:CheY-like chemotaxis protein
MDKSYSILLVDDDKFLLDMYRKKFEASGMKVDVSSNPTEVIDKLKDNHNYDILVFDIIMPGLDGLELLEQVRREGLAKDSIVIMLTNEGDSAKIEKAKSLGVEGYIVKATTIPSEVVDETLKIANAHFK